MKLTLTLVVGVFGVVAAAATASTKQGRKEVATFEEYVRRYGFDWAEHSVEWVEHKLAFEAEQQRVKQHNSRGLPWKEGINKFSALNEKERSRYFGRHKGVKRVYKGLNAQPVPYHLFNTPVEKLPLHVDWRDKGVATAVKDQGSCGSCWCFATTATIESHVALSTGLLFDLSVEQMAMCAPNPNDCGGTGGCGGSTAELAFDYIVSAGFYQDFQLGYPPAAYAGQTQACQKPAGTPVATITGYVQLPTNNYTALMNAIATVGPIAISVDASKWGPYTSGIWSVPVKNTTDIDHLVVLMGYGEDKESGEKYWLVRNSWSPDWGEAGYIRLLRSDDDGGICGLDTTPQNGVACAGDDTPEVICGTSGILFDTSYPVGAQLIN